MQEKYKESYDYTSRHIGLDAEDVEKMLQALGCASLTQCIEESIPKSVRTDHPLDLPDACSEVEVYERMCKLAEKNSLWKNWIGRGYYNSITPAPIRRHVMQNPNWYTSYTPYQAEISQGRLEALLNYQTMVTELTGLPLANASMLDDATATAEALIMCCAATKKAYAACFVLLDQNTYSHVLEVCKGRLQALGISFCVCELESCDAEMFQRADVCLLSYPYASGSVPSLQQLCARIAAHHCRIAVHADLLALALLLPPGSCAVDVCVGSSQEFGIPPGYGGPYAAFFAAKQEYQRLMPGRIVGVSKDALGKQAFRLTLQTREQHIRREKATSNICTAQALLASMAGFFGVYFGQSGLQTYARQVHGHAIDLATGLLEKGYQLNSSVFFRTVEVTCHATQRTQIQQAAEQAQINLAIFDHAVQVSFDVTTTTKDVVEVLNLFPLCENSPTQACISSQLLDSPELMRQDMFMQQSCFRKFRTETELMRYICRLGQKDYSLVSGMIPLGSCTMKLNAVATLEPLQHEKIAALTPWVPRDQALGYQEMVRELEGMLCEITGFTRISFQPNSGAQGEYAGLQTICAYHQESGQTRRDICLIPASAHGTNPASARLAGLQVITLKCDGYGNICWDDFCGRLKDYGERLAVLMITYPSTHGVFEDQVTRVCKAVHQCGGLVYMDGANLNAMVGLCRPAEIGADVMHMNLHKTFAIPHGGGGPGMGPIGVVEKLVPYLPRENHWKRQPLEGAIGVAPVSAAPLGSASILWISWSYLKLLGKHGLRRASEMSILSANYVAIRLQKFFPILYTNENGRVAHECILDLRNFRKTAKVQAMDVAKRLMDYGFHAPTVAFPVPGTLMIEPTESENLAELDRFCTAMESIRAEIADIEEGRVAYVESPLAHAPHPYEILAEEKWQYTYSRATACFPAGMGEKYWPTVARIDEAYGDRNLMCTCS
ncbi:MAG: aminomethyl-transferring glycine dehydrogenase [Zetaproteobacteria bacterium]|nr:aminomethyl-transferring glycine dehydrogenase [Zetaproteobacteria bacterium]